MHKIITKNTFIKIFENSEYRRILDKIILNFFGLENNQIEPKESLKKDDVLLDFTLFINTEYVLKIIIKDTEKLFQSSKHFYINLSYREVDKYHELLMPCYWEIYIPYTHKQQKNTPKLLGIASLFACTKIEEVRKILEKLKEFNELQINDIIKIIEKENCMISKDK